MVARSVERGNLGIAFFFDRDPLMHSMDDLKMITGNGATPLYWQMVVHTPG